MFETFKNFALSTLTEGARLGTAQVIGDGIRRGIRKLTSGSTEEDREPRKSVAELFSDNLNKDKS